MPTINKAEKHMENVVLAMCKLNLKEISGEIELEDDIIYEYDVKLVLPTGVKND